jgi:sec-independent protein translocase protein TatA
MKLRQRRSIGAQPVGLDNPLHIAILVLILLLLFGAKRLPEVGRSLGAGVRGFRESVTGERPIEQVAEGAEGPREAASPTSGDVSGEPIAARAAPGSPA